jgi:hypothetical protein
MSKKSRRRNKKILAVLGALGGAALMAKRKRDASNSVVEANDNAFDIPAVVTTPKKKPAKVYQDDIMKGGKGVKYQKPDIKFGQVINKKGDVQTLKPLENSGLNFGISKRKVDKTANAVNKANREMAKGMLPPQLKNPGRKNITTDQQNFRNFFKTGTSEPSMSGLAEGDFAAKNGGRAKLRSGGKVKGCGIAKRGLGRAMKKGRK